MRRMCILAVFLGLLAADLPSAVAVASPSRPVVPEPTGTATGSSLVHSEVVEYRTQHRPEWAIGVSAIGQPGPPFEAVPSAVTPGRQERPAAAGEVERPEQRAELRVLVGVRISCRRVGRFTSASSQFRVCRQKITSPITKQVASGMRSGYSVAMYDPSGPSRIGLRVRRASANPTAVVPFAQFRACLVDGRMDMPPR